MASCGKFGAHAAGALFCAGSRGGMATILQWV